MNSARTSSLPIQSKDNERFKAWSELLTRKGIKKHGAFLLSGEKLIQEYLQNPKRRYRVQAELHTEQLPPVTLSHELKNEVKRYQLSRPLFEELDVIGTHWNILVLEAEPWVTADLSVSPKSMELVCPLGDPGNLGALIRSAVAFGVSKVILTQEASHPFLPKAVKASAGAVLDVDFAWAPALSQTQLQKWDYFLDGRGRDVANFKWPTDLRLWVGEEGQGWKGLAEAVPRERVITVPTQKVESLNAVVASSIALHSWSASRRG